MNYLKSLRHFYIADGVGNLIDQIAAVNFNELGVVGLNDPDGPPPDLGGTSRGPCDLTTTGFRRIPSGDFWDLRNNAAPTGPKTRTVLGWYRFDSRSTDQEIFGHWEASSAASQGYLWRYEHAFQIMVAHFNGVTANINAGVGPLIVTGAWNFGGFSVDAARDRVFLHSNGVTAGPFSPFGGFANTNGALHTRIGVTVAGVSGSGIKGDIAYVNVFDIAFGRSDWGNFWNGSKGLAFPDGYVGGTVERFRHHWIGQGR